MRFNRLAFGAGFLATAVGCATRPTGPVDAPGPPGPGPVDWSTVAALPGVQQEIHAAVFDGWIYVGGGFDGAPQEIRTVVRYDPQGDRWESSVADLPEPRHHMPLVTVADSLYAVGGLAGSQFNAVNSLWVYLPDENRWESRASMPEPRGASAAVAVGGLLVVVGGFDDTRTLLGQIAIYDPATNQWRTGASLPTPRDHLTAQAVDGLVYAIGGRPRNANANFNVVEVYDPVSDEWSPAVPMPTARGGLSSGLLDGRIHVLGGESATQAFDSHFAFDPGSNFWETLEPMPTPRHGLGAASFGGRLYAIGGGRVAGGGAGVRTVEVYDP